MFSIPFYSKFKLKLKKYVPVISGLSLNKPFIQTRQVAFFMVHGPYKGIYYPFICSLDPHVMQSAHASKIAKNKKRRVKREHV